MQKKKKMFIVLLSMLSILNWPAFEWNDQKALAAINRTVGAPQADSERLKADFSYDIAQLTTKYMARTDREVAVMPPQPTAVV